MAEDRGREHEEHKKAGERGSNHDAPQSPIAVGDFTLPAQTLMAGQPGSLLGDSRLEGRGNGPVKIELIRQMQRTYGNRALQRTLSSVRPRPTVEERRLSHPSGTPTRLASVFSTIVDDFRRRLASTTTLNADAMTVAHEALHAGVGSTGAGSAGTGIAVAGAPPRQSQSASEVVRNCGRALWEAATSRSQAQTGSDTDDRPLYWARLQMTQDLRQWQPSAFRLNSRDRDTLMALLEQTSRGMEGSQVNFSGAPGVKRILISGFDPFSLDRNIEQGNPSGAAALALDGQQINAGSVQAEIQSVVFPVRFRDFDDGLVESFFGQYLTGSNRVDMIMTISQGGTSDFRVEKYAGRRRSGGTDNLNQKKGNRSRPVTPSGLAAGDEFLETALPTTAMLGARSNGVPIVEGSDYLQQGRRGPIMPNPSPTLRARSVTGSGGGFLSNEIFYRARLLRSSTGATIPVGHLHTPYLDPTDPSVEAMRNTIIAQIRQILVAALPTL